ncbi:uncharacterized protein LOC132611756 [Lycium barbarum]|uniref:uncharacterized protein LOC132611756 n=1 Tax=Lycium barbarum TaxID=112863 RepID=UPI00293E188C|nr:uncharacterized protein LOC132611756 [Lycium barbarum]
MVKDLYSSNHWNIVKLRRILPQNIINSIISIEFNLARKDIPIWTSDPSGKFISKSAWHIVRRRKGTTLASSKIWHKKMPFMICFFMWRALQNKIPSDDAVKRFGIYLPSICNCCPIHKIETSQHLLSESKIATQCLPVAICGEIWKNRCRARFEDKKMSTWFIIQQINKLISLVLKAQFPDVHMPSSWLDKCNKMENLRPITHSLAVYWHKPSPNWIKLNVDGCSKGNPGSAGGGGIIRDHTGKMIKAFVEFYGQCSNNVAEANAIWKGVNICKDFGLPRVVVESDSLLIINILNGRLKLPWKIREIMSKIMRDTSHGEFVFIHIYREGNSTADMFANWGEDSKISFIFTEATSLPSKVRASMQLELDGFPNFRFRSKRNQFAIDDS